MVIANEREYSLFSLSNPQALTVLSHGNGLMLKEYLFPFPSSFVPLHFFDFWLF